MSYNGEASSPGGMSKRLTNRNTNRYSVTALFSMAAEQDVEVEDDLARGQAQSPSRRLIGRSLGAHHITII
jgi:Ras GTPase-activating-like protein IQGAP2/3